ncbi:MAG: sulfite exporter TauE/SafE family protein [Lentisphaerae bacterium]|nr:sulfite exporter TauE/SafE family protein [Lentisphaerota bacterium]
MLDLGLIEIAARIVSGTLIGFCIGLTGVGGGVLVIPTLTLLFKLPPSTAVGTASLYAFLTKVAATVHHCRLKNIAARTAAWFLVGAVPATITIAALITRTLARLEGDSSAIQTFQGNLRLFIACLILLSCVMLIVNMIRGLRRTDEERGPSGLAAAIAVRPALHKQLAIGLGALVGGLIGATSVGGGVIMVPLLIFVFGLSSSQTVGTSILIAAVLTPVTSAIYLIGGEIDLGTAISMAAGSMVGVPFGSRLSVRLPENTLKAVVVGVVVVAALLMLAGNGST